MVIITDRNRYINSVLMKMSISSLCCQVMLLWPYTCAQLPKSTALKNDNPAHTHTHALFRQLLRGDTFSISCPPTDSLFILGPHKILFMSNSYARSHTLKNAVFFFCLVFFPTHVSGKYEQTQPFLNLLLLLLLFLPKHGLKQPSNF